MNARKTTEQTLLILNNDPVFSQVLRMFTESVRVCIADGCQYKGLPLSAPTSAGIMVCAPLGKPLNFRDDLPVYLRQAGYQVQQFGMLFVAQGALSFSHGQSLFAAMKDKITASLRRAVGYNDSLAYPVEPALLALLTQIITPTHPRSR